MKSRKAHAALLLALAAGLSTAVVAGGDRVKFPENYAAGVLYTTVDRADVKQFRELYTSPQAIAAAKAGMPLPDGTVVTIVQYKAKLDSEGNPEKDANGHFIKTEIAGYGVMEKRAGWGAEYPEDIRNGDWEYQSFKADKTVNDKADLKKCFGCHKPMEKADYLFTYEAMKTAK